jgi:hypothetical protein
MLRFIGRSLLGLLIVLQAVQPALACPCQSVEVVAVEQACGCEVETVIESDCCCEESEMVVNPCKSCGCEEVSCDESATETNPAEPQSAETKKTETEEPAVTPQPVLPPSTTEAIGPAPINVPSDPAVDTVTEPAAAPATNDVFPGPAATDPTTPATTTPAVSTPAETTPTTEPAPATTNTEGLFDEPAAEPAESAPVEETESSTTTTTEELFVEPSQSRETTEETVIESTETEAEETPPAGDPLDELFSPSTPATEPAPEAESSDENQTDTESTEGEETETPAADPFDPFSHNETPSELRAPGGLASQELRGWSDRANNFKVNARLVRMTADGVFLSDEAGEYVAMSFAQLSDSDLSFVREQVRAQRVVLAKQQAPLVARAAN